MSAGDQVRKLRITKAALLAENQRLSQNLQECYEKLAGPADGAAPPPYPEMIRDREVTIAAHEKTIADLEAKVKELLQWPAIAQEVMRNNTRLTTTLDNMAKAAAGLVPAAPQTMANRN